MHGVFHSLLSEGSGSDGTQDLQTFLTGIDTSFFDVTNPGTPYPSISASSGRSLLVSSTSGQGTSTSTTTNRIQTDSTVTSGVVAVDFYAASAPITTGLHFYVDENNRVSLLPVPATGLARLYVVVGGSVVYSYTPATINAYRTRWKIVIDGSNNISCWYWNLTSFQWTQFGVTQVANIGTNKYGVIGVSNVNTETGAARFDNFSLTSYNYTTRYPRANYVYPDPVGLQDMLFNGFVNMIWNYQAEPSALTIGNLTYIPTTTQGTSTLNYFILVYNHETDSMSDLIRCNDSNLFYNSSDVHNAPAIYKGGDKLYMTVSPRGGTNDLKTIYASSASIENIYNWSTGWTVRNTDTTSRTSEYWHYKTLSTGRIISIERGKTSGSERKYVDFLYSDDDGATWTRRNIITYTNNPLNEALYPLVYFDASDTIRVFMTIVKVYTVGTDERMPSLYYMESTDGITWRNVSNSYSKNVTSAVITDSDISNYLAYSITDATGNLIRANSACLINDKPACIAGIDDDNTTGLVYWDGSVWQKKAIVCAGHTIAPSYEGTTKYSNSSVLLFRNGVTDWYGHEIVSGYVQTSHFRSTDLGDNWTFVRQVTTGSYDHNTVKLSRRPDGTPSNLMLILRIIDADSGTFLINRI
jgi:hypothetical protein